MNQKLWRVSIQLGELLPEHAAAATAQYKAGHTVRRLVNSRELRELANWFEDGWAMHRVLAVAVKPYP